MASSPYIEWLAWFPHLWVWVSYSMRNPLDLYLIYPFCWLNPLSIPTTNKDPAKLGSWMFIRSSKMGEAQGCHLEEWRKFPFWPGWLPGDRSLSSPWWMQSRSTICEVELRAAARRDHFTLVPFCFPMENQRRNLCQKLVCLILVIPTSE